MVKRHLYEHIFKCKVGIHEPWLQGWKKDLADVSNILGENLFPTIDM